MFNDLPASNRFYAYLANIEITDFNKLEMEVLKRLSFNALINTEDYRNYEEALNNFCQNRSEVLAKCYLDYKHDKKILKEIKNEISDRHQAQDCDPVDTCINSNYHDPQINQFITKSNESKNCCLSMESTKEFRFESYNSHSFRRKGEGNRKKQRSRSLPSNLVLCSS